jgi:DegV family protein with EDD domain
MTTTIRVVSDSACDLPDELIAKHDIDVVPLTIRFDDEEFVDRVELSNPEFWARAARSATLPSTAAPSPGAFEAAFRRAAEQGATGVVCVTLSSKLSATYQAAVTAARAVADDIDVRVVDSRSVNAGHGLICLQAAELAEAATPLDDLVAQLEEIREQTHIVAALDTLDNLRKGGRIGAASAFFGSLLSVKPIVTLRDGEVQAESRQRTRTRALTHLKNLVEQQAPVDRVAVSHANASDLETFLAMLRPVVGTDNLFVTHIGPVIGAHVGPGVIGVAFVKRSANSS